MYAGVVTDGMTCLQLCFRREGLESGERGNPLELVPDCLRVSNVSSRETMNKIEVEILGGKIA